MPDTSLLVIFPTWPSTHHGHFVRSRKYRTTYMWLRPRTNFRVWPGSRLDKMAPRNPCWRRYIHRSTWSGRSAVSIPAAGRALACTWTRKIVRACERVCVCGGGTYTRVLVERGRCGIPGIYLAIRSSILHWYVTCVADIGGNGRGGGAELWG